MTLWLAGGRQGRPAGATDRDHEPLYDEARLVAFDPTDLAVTPLLARRSPPEVCGGAPRGVGHVFKGLATDRDGAWVCTEREVLRLDRAGAAREVRSHPWLNDLHHAAPLGGRLHLAASGLDGVIRWGEPPEWVPLEGAPAPVGELRAARLKPHRAHPNHLWEAGGRAFVTLGVLGAVWPLDGNPVRISDRVIHDGVPGPDGLVWLTAVDGRLLGFDPVRQRVVREVVLPAEGREPLGWCRGLRFVDGRAWVGFTRLRTTRSRAALAWARGALRGRPVATRRPTRIVAYELDPVRKIAEVPLEPYGLDALFAIDHAPDSIPAGA